MKYVSKPLKRLKSVLIIFCIILSASSVIYADPVEIWVAVDGSSTGKGTKEDPFNSLSMALRKAREMRRLKDPSIADGINIKIRGGVYQLDEPVAIRPEDSGTEQSPTTISAVSGEHPVFSGGVEVKGWKKLEGAVSGLPKGAEKEIWVANVPEIGGRRLEFRQLWVDDLKAIRASNLNDGPLDRILSVDKENEAFWIPKPDIALEAPGQLEFVIHQWWAIANLRVKKIEFQGDSARIFFHQPESQIEFEHPWPAPFIDKEQNLNGNSAFYLVNAIELLNQPGEWYEDINEGKVYYWPRKGENLKKAKVVVPHLETLVKVAGTLDRPVAYLHFKDINFAHTTWMRPSRAGHVPLQAGFYLLEAYKLPEPGTPDKATLENQAWIGRQPAGVSLKAAHHITIENCSFQHMAATGLDLIFGTHHNKVIGSVFRDIGGTGIQMGFFGDDTFEAHLPYNPVDERVVTHHELISNNLVTDCTNEDWGCVGIGVGYAHDINIEHNEVSHVNYSGISVGWGWTRTISCMRNNRVHANEIHHFAKQMYDVGGIYTLSAQPNTEISQNSIHHLEKAPYAHIPEHYQYIYYDEGSSYIRAIDNWTEKDKFFSNSPGPGNEWKNNGPGVSDKIRKAAGLKPEYKKLLRERK